jgi:GTP:adenosylcobinamide-phosphate guanylyltransferase
MSDIDDSGVRGVTAVVLAGGGGDALAQAAGVPCKALLPFQGRPLVSYVLEALLDTPGVARIVYVGEAPPSVTASCDKVVPPGGSFIESFAVGAEAALALETAPVLFTTADLPWLSREALSDFLDAAAGADLAYPIVRQETTEAQFPAQRRTFVKLKDGRFTGGNLMLLSPRMVPALLPFIERAYQGRKNPLTLARLFGFDFIFRLLSGRLSLPHIERRAERILGLPVRALETPHASIGADIDKLEHLT